MGQNEASLVFSTQEWYLPELMDAVIISIGTELTTGQCVDTNAAWLSERLTQLGADVIRHATVKDHAEQIRTAVADALGNSDLVVLTGGLGPTPDDVTRHAIADAIGEPLVEDAAAIAQIRDMFERLQRTLHESNKIQALIPKGCTAIPNARGTAPGIRLARGDQRLFALPGVPTEMKAMFEAEVAPELTIDSDSPPTQHARLLCFGISEAKLGEILADLMSKDRNPSVGTTASQAIISVRVVARGNGESDARSLLEEDITEIRRRLGRVVFGQGEESLQGVATGLLLQLGKTISTAESCTGGLLAGYLTDTPGSSACFLRGYVTYANEAKRDTLHVAQSLIDMHGAVSEPVAQAMASGCRLAAGTDLALSITGIAGPTGGSPPDKPVGLVYIGLADSAGVEVKRMLFGEHLDRAEIRDRSCKTALNLLRLRLL